MTRSLLTEAAVRLESIFLVSKPTKETLEGYNLDGRNVLRPSEEIPDLTEEQVGQAMAVIPAYPRTIGSSIVGFAKAPGLVPSLALSSP